jgi:ParB-like chromosome segregation protein Spo0J
MSQEQYPISMFVTNPWNFNVMNEDESKSLYEDYLKNGLQDTIEVRRKGESFEIVDGEQRITSLKAHGVQSIPVSKVDIKELSDVEVRSRIRSKLIRGSRKDLIKEAEHYLSDMEARGCKSMREYGEILGMDQSKISRVLSRINLPEPAKALVSKSNISSSVLDAILTAPPDKATGLIQKAIEEKWTYETARDEVRAIGTLTGKNPKERESRVKNDEWAKIDMVERAAISSIVDGCVALLSKTMIFSELRGSSSIGMDFKRVIDTLNKNKKSIDGSRVVYPTKQGDQVKTMNVVRDWIVSGSDEERKERMGKIDAKTKEIIGDMK